VAGPLESREGILYAEIDPGRAAGSRWIFDAAGHYSRGELFDFAVRDGAANEAKPRRLVAPKRAVRKATTKPRSRRKARR